jgi:hypothetical protein
MRTLALYVCKCIAVYLWQIFQLAIDLESVSIRADSECNDIKGQIQHEGYTRLLDNKDPHFGPQGLYF